MAKNPAWGTTLVPPKWHFVPPHLSLPVMSCTFPRGSQCRTAIDWIGSTRGFGPTFAWQTRVLEATHRSWLASSHQFSSSCIISGVYIQRPRQFILSSDRAVSIDNWYMTFVLMYLFPKIPTLCTSILLSVSSRAYNWYLSNLPTIRMSWGLLLIMRRD